MTDGTTRYPTALILSIAPLAGNASRVEWVARIKVDHRAGGFALA